MAPIDILKIVGAAIIGELFLGSLMFGFLRNRGFGLTWGVPTDTPWETSSWFSGRKRSERELEEDAKAWAQLLSVFWPVTTVAIIVALIVRAGIWFGRSASQLGSLLGGWLAGRKSSKIPEAKVHKK